jgi:DNA end-binding protein Ku
VIDPIFFDKAYYLAPDKKGGKTYSLLIKAMRSSGRCALAKWAWRSKEYVVQIRAIEGGLVLQQLLYAEEVRPIADLQIEFVETSDVELKLALQLIGHLAIETYDATQYVDEEKKRILAAVKEKISNEQFVVPEPAIATARGGEVVDLIAALKESLGQGSPRGSSMSSEHVSPARKRKPPRRAATATRIAPSEKRRSK